MGPGQCPLLDNHRLSSILKDMNICMPLVLNEGVKD